MTRPRWTTTQSSSCVELSIAPLPGLPLDLAPTGDPPLRGTDTFSTQRQSTTPNGTTCMSIAGHRSLEATGQGEEKAKAPTDDRPPGNGGGSAGKGLGRLALLPPKQRCRTLSHADRSCSRFLINKCANPHSKLWSLPRGNIFTTLALTGGSRIKKNRQPYTKPSRHYNDRRLCSCSTIRSFTLLDWGGTGESGPKSGIDVQGGQRP